MDPPRTWSISVVVLLMVLVLEDVSRLVVHNSFTMCLVLPGTLLVIANYGLCLVRRHCTAVYDGWPLEFRMQIA